jgi:hypothetical protein
MASQGIDIQGRLRADKFTVGIARRGKSPLALHEAKPLRLVAANLNREE